jgi:hypothetical protein
VPHGSPKLQTRTEESCPCTVVAVKIKAFTARQISWITTLSSYSILYRSAELFEIGEIAHTYTHSPFHAHYTSRSKNRSRAVLFTNLSASSNEQISNTLSTHLSLSTPIRHITVTDHFSLFKIDSTATDSDNACLAQFRYRNVALPCIRSFSGPF